MFTNGTIVFFSENSFIVSNDHMIKKFIRVYFLF